jgi:hypothetical protein
MVTALLEFIYEPSWPRALEHVFVSSMLGSIHVSRIFSSLELHAASLKKISIYSTNRCLFNGLDDDLIFDATQFPRLETLVWSRWQMANDLEFAPDDAKLLGPALPTSVWDFDDWNKNNILL